MIILILIMIILLIITKIILILILILMIMMLMMLRCDSGWHNWRLGLANFAQRNRDHPQVPQIL